MGFTSSYAAKLKHPLWQKKRLEVLSAADFTCEACGAKDQSLHVHHGFYEKGHEPWEYPESSLSCLCEACHELMGLQRRSLHWSIGWSLPFENRVFGYSVCSAVWGDHFEQIPVAKWLITEEFIKGALAAIGSSKNLGEINNLKANDKNEVLITKAVLEGLL